MNVVLFIKKNELLLALSLIFIPYILLFKIIEIHIWLKMILFGFSWFGVLLLGDFFNNKVNKDNIFFSKKLTTKRVLILSAAAFFMNLFSDVTGSWLTRLWYYPNTHLWSYFTLFAPLGYLLFGLILFIFYHAFKGMLNSKVKGGRTKKKAQKMYKAVVSTYPFLFLLLTSISIIYFYNLVTIFPVNIFDVRVSSEITVDLLSTFSIWFGVFFLLEFLCYKQNKETLTRDIIRHNYIPLISIFLSSLIIIVLIEWFNTPFQAWTFDNWTGEQYQFLSIPAFAYLIWPIQYLVLLPLIRFLDNSNRENVW